ncbi:hypothetical protein HO173_012157 [Letharia columbiana]|uniref:Uncharacterized protein n=1 Tax=Letharia columbiana TaxID=112416 RepID=A0A8H6FH30_9LECA|nr:uncharacterized protein HO173_012157 [Letharia columbiana]KAF6227628.1 hypothetical protein HO173_012157 [Letharia columbiana]
MTAGITKVTKVVAVTSFVDSMGLSSSSAVSDQSHGVDVITKVVRVGPTTVNTANCQPLLCSLNVASVSVFYWPQQSANTACLSTISSPPSALPPAGLNPQSSSIYAIFYSLSLSNGCGSLSTTYDSITMSFTPGALSTVNPFGDSAEVFNFADLPCPPPGLYVEPGQLYQPQFAPPRAFFSSLRAADPAALQGCSDGVWADGWTDPPIAFITAGALTGPGLAGGGRPPRRIRNIPANAHVTARTPTKTADAP